MSEFQMIPTHNTIKKDRVYIALELSDTKWKIAMGNGFKIRQKTIEARDLKQFRVKQ